MGSLRCILLSAAFAASILLIDASRHFRAIDGEETDITSAPWLVQVEYASLTPPYKINPTASCSGSIITRRQIITAAHCFPEGPYRVHARKFMRIRVGATKKNEGGKTYNILTVELHPEHVEGDSLDVAVVTTSKDIEYGPTVQAIPIIVQKPEDGSYLRAGGWGVSSRTEVAFHHQLKTVSMNLRDHDNCTGFLQRAPLKKYNNDNYMCLDGMNGITGSGDSGCGLWIQEDSSPKLAGVLKGGWTKRNLDLFVDINMPAITEFLEKNVFGYKKALEWQAEKEAEAAPPAADATPDEEPSEKATELEEAPEDMATPAQAVFEETTPAAEKPFQDPVQEVVEEPVQEVEEEAVAEEEKEPVAEAIKEAVEEVMEEAEEPAEEAEEVAEAVKDALEESVVEEATTTEAQPSKKKPNRSGKNRGWGWFPPPMFGWLPPGWMPPMPGWFPNMSGWMPPMPGWVAHMPAWVPHMPAMPSWPWG